MAWYNPATWTIVDNLQGQNKKSSTPSQDPNKVVGYINGRPYNYGGDFLDGGPKYGNTPSPSSNANAEWQSLLAQLRSAQNYRPPTPKLASFDIMSNWRNAQSAAERAQNPLYEKKLNDFLAHNAKKKQSKQNEFGLTNENIDLEKAQALEDSAVSRQRTSEDTTAALEKIGQNEGIYQTDEGQDFDKNYRATAEQLAASGAAGTGLGRQQSSDAIRLRNVQSQRQLDEFNGQREAKQLFKTRTFEDLARGDERATTLATNKKKAAQFDLDAYLEDLAYDETNFRSQNEIDRLEAVLRDSQNYEKAGVESFLAGLAGQGYSAQDIAYNRQVYA